MMARASRTQLVVAIQYLSLQHRSLLVAADTRMSSKDRGYACAAESRLCDGAVDRVESIVMDAGIRRRRAGGESTPASIRGINVGGKYQVGSRRVEPTKRLAAAVQRLLHITDVATRAGVGRGRHTQPRAA